MNPKTNQPYKEKRAALREGVDDFLKFLAERNIKTGIITAANKGGVESIPTTLRQAGVDFDHSIISTSFPQDKDRYLDPKTKEALGYQAQVLPYKDKDSGEELSINQCHGIVSCSSAYDKQTAIKFLMGKMDPPPELFIYCDDGAMNVVNIFNQFNSSVRTYAAFFPHAQSHDEPNHEEAMAIMAARNKSQTK